MSPRGKLIALEGIDGSGKRTQLDLLAGALEARGLATMRISFPRYESSFGKLVARYLNGEFGSIAAVDPHLSALLYAGDRFEAKANLNRPGGGQDRTCRSLHRLESRASGRTRPPAHGTISRLAQAPGVRPLRPAGGRPGRVFARSRRGGAPADRPEVRSRLHLAPARYSGSDVSHLEQTALIYDRLATGTNWVRIDCIDPVSGGLYSPEEIHRVLLNTVDSRIFPWRPRNSEREKSLVSFSEFLGNPRIVAALRGMLAGERVPHAMLFTGPRGVGKFTLARMFAQAANCERFRDDFCGECDTCRRIGLLADTVP